MEKMSKSIIGILILAIIAITIGATIKKVYDEHTEKLLRVVTQEIEEAAEVCNREGKCGEETTLKFLVEKNYLSMPVHPISKEFVDENLAVTCKDYNCETEVK